jgi:excisionase family DNA binding protein
MTAKTHRLGLTTSEAARHLGVSLSTIRRWSDLGYLRGYRTPGGQRRFSAEQLDEFIDSLQSGGPLRQATPEPETPDAPTFEPGNAFRDDEARFRAQRPLAPDAEPEPEPGDER